MKYWIGMSVLLLAACGDEPQVAPQDMCEAEGLSYFAQGSLKLSDGTHLPLSFSGTALPYAVIANSEMQFEFGNVKFNGKSTPFHLRFRESEDQRDLLDLYANLSEEGPVDVTITDSSEVDTSLTRRSDLTVYDCALANLQTCAQSAFDSTGEDVISDSDAAVFNAKAGVLRVVSVNNNSSNVKFTFDLEFGSNILNTEDSASGTLTGCIDARYSSGNVGWNLQ